MSTHALVVGGTGMLQGVSLHLTKAFEAVSVLARDERRLRALEEAGCGAIHGYGVDYRDDDALRNAIGEACATYGPLDLAVCWIHAVAPEAPFVVAEDGAPRVYVHVLGSAAADPARPEDERRARFEAYPGLVYREVILGFVHGDGHSRWLTNAEISDGVIAAIDSNEIRSVVGTTRPWSARP